MRFPMFVRVNSFSEPDFPCVSFAFLSLIHFREVSKGNMTNLIAEHVSTEKESVKSILVRQTPVLTGRFVKPAQFAEYLGIPLRWIYRHIKDIPHHRVGKYLRFDLESPALRHWIQNLERRPQQ